MCMVLYLAADAPLRALPDEMPPAPLSVRPIDAREDEVSVHLTKPYVYFIGSHTGCSCGFQYGELVDEDAEGRESVRQLGEYLSEAVTRAGPVELFACWDGDEAKPSSKRVAITPQYFTPDAEAFDLVEGWHATISAPPANERSS